MKDTVVTSYDELIEALRIQAGDMKLTVEALDRITGLPSGYVGKILGAKLVRTLGRESFGLMLEGLGLELVVRENAEKVARIMRRGEERKMARPLRAIARTKRATWLMTSKDARRNARKLWEKRTPKQRAQWARMMRKKRTEKFWKKKREARKREREQLIAARAAIIVVAGECAIVSPAIPAECPPAICLQP